MKTVIVISLAASALYAFASCDQRPAPKFRVGDRVRVKATHEEGTVSVRTRLFRDDHYFVRFRGSDDVRLPIGDPAFNAAFAAKYGAPPDPMTMGSHEEGIFYDTELDRIR
jgi:D-serine deaminase-like pyridoxal phosphate-dependent protein